MSARWSLFFLAAVCASLGVWASTVTLQFFDEGSRLMEPSSTAQGVVKAAAMLLVALEMAAFGIAALLPGRLLRGQRWALAAFALAVLAFECVTITVVQHGIAVGAARAANASDTKASELRASIAAKRESAAQRRAAAAVAGQSVILASRLSAAASFAAADELEARADSLAAELAALEASKPAPISDVLGERGTLIYAVARGLLVSAGGLVMFGAAGALVRVARGSGVAARGADTEQAGAAVMPISVVRMGAEVPFAPQSEMVRTQGEGPWAPSHPMVRGAEDALPAPSPGGENADGHVLANDAPAASLKPAPPKRTSAIGKSVLELLTAGPMRKADLVRQFAGVHTRGAVYRAVAGLVEEGRVALNGDVVALIAPA
jgi:hypothetical protein